MKTATKTTLVILILASLGISYAQQVTNIYYSVDIGSDIEFSDPNQDGDEVLDPGDIYGVQIGLPQSRQATKNDALIFNGIDPDPSSTATKVPVQDWGYFDVEWPGMYFDMDGEDQLTNKFVNLEEIMPTMQAGGGLILNPDILLFSYEDDTKLGWWRNDVPVTIIPDHGVQTNELLYSTTWYSWMTDMPYSDEYKIGLAQNPTVTPLDDDVDALDTETNRYWYWTSDHEAHMGTDPGDIYLTDRNVGGYATAIDNLVLGVNDGTDIDGFEFCITDDIAILANYGLPASGAPYLAVIFSVDEDDPDTVLNDESGGLSPSGIYISLLMGQMPGPMLLTEKMEDVDAIALDEYEKDWGDAPSSYPTLSANNGARHTISNGYHLGALIDSETDGQPTIFADGDDLTDLDDEDGIKFSSTMYAGQMASLIVTATGNGFLSAWIDYNNNGDWNDSADVLFTGLAISQGTNYIMVTVPDNGSPIAYNTFARFRFASQPVVSHSGLATDGEVEDYIVVIQPDPDEYPEEPLDYGDADGVYPTMFANNGARHAFSPILLGALWDSEFDGQPTADAMGDNLNGLNDEDGVSQTSSFIRGSNAVIQVVANGKGFLNAWLDYNHDNDWADLGEQFITDKQLLTGTTNILFNIPASAELGDTTARFRYSSITGLGYDGFAANGEVEDYLFSIMQIASTNLVITNMVAMTNSNVEVKWNNEPNILYQVQTTTNLTTNTTWYTIKTVTGGMSIDSNATDQLKYYRIVAPFTP